MRNEIPLRGGDEYDALTRKAKTFHVWRAGVRKKIKHRFNKRGRRLAAAAIALLLAGCASAPPPITVTRTQYVHQHIPPSLLTCQAAPPVPAFTSQSVVASYMVNLWASGMDCRAKVAAIAGIVHPPAAKKP